MTDDMVKSLCKTSLDLLKFARANGLHNKPLPKVSTDEEELIVILNPLGKKLVCFYKEKIF